MKRLFTFLALAFVFSVSLATATTPTNHFVGAPQTISKMIAPIGTTERRQNNHAVVPTSVQLLTVGHFATARNRFIPPPLKYPIEVPSIKRSILIGKSNINCYGGTAAKLARG